MIILGLLQGKWPDIDPDFAAWIDQDVVRIAGLRRLENAIPFLIERAHLAAENTADHCGQALGRIGTDAVINAIVTDWECGDFNFRLIMCDALKMIHSDLCANACLEFLDDEQDGEVQVELGYAVLSHFRSVDISPVHQLVEGDIDDLFPEQRDRRFRLVAVAAIMDLHVASRINDRTATLPRQPRVKTIELIELTHKELGGEQPTAGSEVKIRGVRCRILEVKPPKTRSSKWRRKTEEKGEPKWQLLVEKME